VSSVDSLLQWPTIFSRLCKATKTWEFPFGPSNLIDPYWEGQVGSQLRSLLNDNGFSDVILIGYDHNWDDAGEYPVELVRIFPPARRDGLHLPFHETCFTDGGCGQRVRRGLIPLLCLPSARVPLTATGGVTSRLVLEPIDPQYHHLIVLHVTLVAFYSFIGGVNDHSSLGAFWITTGLGEFSS